MKIVDLAENYYKAADGLTEDQIKRLNSALQKSYEEVERRIKYYLSQNQSSEAIQLELRRLSQIRQFYALNDPTDESLLKASAPQVNKLSLSGSVAELFNLISLEPGSRFDKSFFELLFNANHIGWLLAEELIKANDPQSVAQDFGVADLDAATEQVRDGLVRLRRHTVDFATAASGIVEQGLISGAGTVAIAKDLREKLGVLKSKAETIARTEVASALISSARKRYASDGIDLGQVFVTPSDDLCGYCTARNGNVYRIEDCRVPWHPRCVPGDTVVSGNQVLATTSREYVGDIVIIETALGNKLTITPNHPVLTDKGFIAASSVENGFNLLSCLNSDSILSAINPNNYQSPTLIEEIAASFGKSSSMFFTSVEASPEDFHADVITQSKVNIVFSDSYLRDTIKSQLSQVNLQKLLVRGNANSSGFSPFRYINLNGFTPFGASNSFICRRCISFMLFGRSLTHHQPISLSLTSDRNISIKQDLSNDTSTFSNAVGDRFFRLPRPIPFNNNWSNTSISLNSSQNIGFGNSSYQASLIENSRKSVFTDPVLPCTLLNRFPTQIQRDRVINVTHSFYSGYVYNLETKDGWYTANNIIVHNCRCLVTPFSFDWDWQNQQKEVIDYAAGVHKNAPNGIDEGKAPFERMENRSVPVPVWSPLSQIQA